MRLWPRRCHLVAADCGADNNLSLFWGPALSDATTEQGAVGEPSLDGDAPVREDVLLDGRLVALPVPSRHPINLVPLRPGREEKTR